MEGRELVVKNTKPPPLDLREAAARMTLRNVRQKGHIYVELRRKAGKRSSIFFCTLCLTPCHNDAVLFDHLGGKMHAKRYDAAKTTLLGALPWPFSDGMLFFNPSREKEEGADGMSLVVRNVGGDVVDDNLSGVGRVVAYEHKKASDRDGGLSGTDTCLMIKGVLIKEHVVKLRVDLVGLGEVAIRIQEFDEGRRKVSRIWCAWLGRPDSGEERDLALPGCEFAIVAFSYSYGLGKRSGVEDANPVQPSLCTGSFSETEEFGTSGKKGKKSSPELEDSSDSLNIRSTSSKSQDANTSVHSQSSRSISNKAIRSEIRKRKRLSSEKICDICAQTLLPGKDVATLLNCKTGNLACSSRNRSGAFHMFHVSCLIHWILLCDSEIRNYRLSNVKPARGRKAKGAMKKISSVLCPECQGTGKRILGDELEKPTIPLTEMFRHKMKAIKAHKSWMKDPEDLQRCSTGLHFPSDSEEKLKEEVTPVKLLQFYRAV